MGWRVTSRGSLAAIAVTLAAAGCGGNMRQDASEPSGKFPVRVTSARFPTAQTLSQHTHLVIAVRNSGNNTIPNLAVTICNVSCQASTDPGAGSGAQAFSENLAQADLANPSRPVWIVDTPPGHCEYSCAQGGPGGAVTAYANTWALGPLAPGDTTRFDWGVTAVKPGRHVVSYVVAAGLNGKAQAITDSGSSPQGSFKVTVSNKPAQAYVNDHGGIVSSH